MANEISAHAADLAAEIGGIPADSYENNPAAALEIMAHALALPRLETQAERHRYGNEILAAVGANFPYSYNAPFRDRLSTWVGVSQELPQFTRSKYLEMSNEELVKQYLRTRRILFAMKAAGLGKGAQVGRGAAEGAKKEAIDSLKKFKLPDGSNLFKGAKSGAGRNLPKSPAQAIVWIVGLAAYDVLSQDREAMSRELRRRWKNKALSRTLYEKAFGDVMLGFDVDENRKPSEQYEKPGNYKIEANP
jgi:hypothetical protein